jgi:hypothetical protein
MNLEIVLTDGILKISADWFWYLLLTILIIFQCILSILKIQEIFFKRKMELKKLEQRKTNNMRVRG